MVDLTTKAEEVNQEIEDTPSNTNRLDHLAMVEETHLTSSRVVRSKRPRCFIGMKVMIQMVGTVGSTHHRRDQRVLDHSRDYHQLTKAVIHVDLRR